MIELRVKESGKTYYPTHTHTMKIQIHVCMICQTSIKLYKGSHHEKYQHLNRELEQNQNWKITKLKLLTKCLTKLLCKMNWFKEIVSFIFRARLCPSHIKSVICLQNCWVYGHIWWAQARSTLTKRISEYMPERMSAYICTNLPHILTVRVGITRSKEISFLNSEAFPFPWPCVDIGGPGAMPVPLCSSWLQQWNITWPTLEMCPVLLFPRTI